MLVLKFGGTSVGKPERMRTVARLISKANGRKLVVLSALSGTTNTLVSIGEKLGDGNREQAHQLIGDLKKHYDQFIAELFPDATTREQAAAILEEHFGWMNKIADGPFTDERNRELLAQGELISTKLFFLLVGAKDPSIKLLPALDFMSVDEHHEPRLEEIRKQLNRLLDQNPAVNMFITQGYICRNPKGEVDNLKRGGSDYTASLIGAAVGAQEVQIWTDIDGMHNNDPRIVEKTLPISELSFDEASELAYFGAKILHPSTIVPAQKYNIPVRLKNTMDENAPGTIIAGIASEGKIKAIAAKDQITAIKIKSSRMLMAYGFLVKVFEVFERFKTPIDMITTSEVAISLTIDNDERLPSILGALREFGTIEVDKDQTIICIVGHQINGQKGILKAIFDSLGQIPIRMVSSGGSSNNISILIDSSSKVEALKALNRGLFGL